MRHRKSPLACLLLVAALLVAAPLAARAGEFQVVGYGGYTFPFYSQTFSYDAGQVTVPVPGVSVEQTGEFELRASGRPAFGAAATFYATDGFGVELRYDHAGVKVDTRGASYAVRVGLPQPLDPVTANVSLSEGVIEVGSLAPWSFNLKLRSGGRARFTTSFGASRLGDLEATLEQSIGLGVIGFDFVDSSIEIATLGVRATATGLGESSWGGNLGFGLEIPIGERAALLLEARGFYFPKRTVSWEPVLDRELTDFEEQLLERVLERLPPVEFEPWWVQASFGFAIRF